MFLIEGQRESESPDQLLVKWSGRWVSSGLNPMLGDKKSEEGEIWAGTIPRAYFGNIALEKNYQKNTRMYKDD